ncbi:MAG: hypothetical protein V1495_02255 [Pseudomonadota bacterium]
MNAIPLVSLFLSGFGALLLQVVWTRSGILIFGSTTVAVTIVVSTFMGGLAIGYAIVGRWVKRVRRPFLTYGAIEGITAFVAAGSSLFLKSGPSSWDAPAWLVILAVLVPTVLMGLTVPLVVAGYERRDPNRGMASVGWAYGINTLGGAVGALVGAFWILPQIGAADSGWLGSFLLLVAGILTAAVAGPIGSLKRAEKREPGNVLRTPAGPVWAIAALSGACGLSLEIVWTRLLSLIFGPSVYALGIVLSVNLVGLGLGALLCPFVLRRVPRTDAVAGALLLGSFAIAFGTSMVGVLPYLFLFFVETFRPRIEMVRGLELLLTVLTILPATMLQGLLLPILVAWRSDRSAAEYTGSVFSVNTAGSIVGAVLTGLWIIPKAGLLAATLLFFGLYLLAGLAVFGWRRQPLVSVLLIVFLVLFPFRLSRSWDRSVLVSGVYKYAVGTALAGKTAAEIEIGKLLFYREGVSSTVAVIETGNDRSLSIDGKVDATARGDRSTQVLLGALPLSFSRRTDTTLVIGFASGVTAGVSSLFPRNRVTAVEIEPAVYEASKFFEDVNHGPLHLPSHELLVNDARHFLLRTPRRFDVITSEPSNPWMSGVAPLFTREFFQLSSSHLAPGGVMCQWLPIYGMAHELVASVMRTFADVFPHVLVFESIEGYDLLMLGSFEPIRMQPHAVDSRWTSGELRKELEGIRITTGLDLIGRFTMAEKGIRQFAGDVSLNTDDNGLLEYGAPKSLHLRTAKENNARISRSSAGFEGYLDRSILGRDEIGRLREKVLQRHEIHLAEELE